MGTARWASHWDETVRLNPDPRFVCHPWTCSLSASSELSVNVVDMPAESGHRLLVLETRRSMLVGLVALLMAVMTAGLPQIVLELGFDRAASCSSDCDDAHGGHCPPTCSDGTCAKVASLPPTASVALARPAPEVERVLDGVPRAHFRDAPNDVYHPPRA